MPVEKGVIPNQSIDGAYFGRAYMPGTHFHGKIVKVVERSKEHIHAYKCETERGFSLIITRSNLLFVKLKNLCHGQP